MATRNPRVNVCVSPVQHELLRKLAHLQGCSAASLVKSMLDAAEPLMLKTVAILDIAEDAKGETKEAARNALQAVLEELHALSGETGQLDLLNLLSGVPSGHGAVPHSPSGARAEGSAPPPSSNTGVRSPARTRIAGAHHG